MKKLLVSFLAAFVLFPLASKVVLAAKSTIPEVQQKEAGIINSQTTNQPNLESYGTNSYKGLLTDTYWSLMGGEPQATTSQSGGILNISYSEGVVGGMGRMIAGMYGNPAATTERYVADVLNSAGVKIAQPAYAQGLGFSSLDPILETWKTFRNVAYLGFVIIFLVIGFLIMLRQQVGQTAVTAQQAIPQIIVALLLVTFSYAIAGLLIDLMYLVMYLFLGLFVENSNWPKFIDHNTFTLGLTMVTAGWTTAYEAVNQFVDTVLVSDFWSAIGNAIGGLTLAVIVSFAIAFKIFELFIELLKTYVTIILSITFSPVILMLGAIPGKNPAKQWLTDLIGNLAAFPIVLMVLIIFNELTGGIVGDASMPSDGGFMPPYLLNSETGFSGAVAMMVGLGMILIMPNLVKKGKEALGVKEGIFTQLAQNVGDSLKKGVQGGELIPGLGITNTNKLPGGQFLGSGQSVLKTGASLGGALVSGTGGAIVGGIQGAKGARETIQEREAMGRTVTSSEKRKLIFDSAAESGWSTAKESWRKGGGKTARTLSHDPIFPESQKEIEEQKNEEKKS